MLLIRLPIIFCEFYDFFDNKVRDENNLFLPFVPFNSQAFLFCLSMGLKNDIEKREKRRLVLQLA